MSPMTASAADTVVEVAGRPVHQRRLDNGLLVQVQPDDVAPVAAVNLWYDVGSRHEAPGRTGFAHLFEHLMFQGSAQVERSQHLAIVERHGGSANATTSFDRTNYFETLPAGALELALWLEADRMDSLLSALDQPCLDNQREVVKEEKRQRYDNAPYGDLLRRSIEIAFPADHPYGHPTIGSMADLDAASLADVHAFFDQHYMPSNAVLSVVGHATADQVFELVERQFGPIPDRARSEIGRPDPLPPLIGRPRDDRTAEVPAETVTLVFRLPALGTAEFEAVDLALSVLGDGMSARLHRRLVRGEELAVDVSASTIGLIGGTSLGLVMAHARDGVDLARIEAAIEDELVRFAAEGPTDAELGRTRAQFERAWWQAMARLPTRADQFSRASTLFGDLGALDRQFERTLGLDAEAVRAAAALVLPDHAGAVLHRQPSSSGATS